MNQVYRVRKFICDLGFDVTVDGDPVTYENCEWVICERNDATEDPTFSMCLRTDSFNRKCFWPNVKIGDEFIQALTPLEEADEATLAEATVSDTPYRSGYPRPGDPNYATFMDKISKGIENENPNIIREQ